MTQALIAKVDEPILETGEGFEDLAWIFTCDSRNRGLIRQGFDEAALLWKAVKATSGNILELGRNLAGSTVLLAAAAEPAREIYSIDNRSNEDSACKAYLIRHGLAAKWRSAGSMLVLKKLADLPRNFSEIARKVRHTEPVTLSGRGSRHSAANLVDNSGAAEFHGPWFTNDVLRFRSDGSA